MPSGAMAQDGSLVEPMMAFTGSGDPTETVEIQVSELPSMTATVYTVFAQSPVPTAPVPPDGSQE
jgi:hypothetical protein